MDSEDSETLTPLLVEIMNDLPRECITDDKFVEAYSAMRRRPDGKSLGLFKMWSGSSLRGFSLYTWCDFNSLKNR